MRRAVAIPAQPSNTFGLFLKSQVWARRKLESRLWPPKMRFWGDFGGQDGPQKTRKNDSKCHLRISWRYDGLLEAISGYLGAMLRPSCAILESSEAICGLLGGQGIRCCSPGPSEGSLLGGHSRTIFSFKRGPKTEHFFNVL